MNLKDLARIHDVPKCLNAPLWDHSKEERYGRFKQDVKGLTLDVGCNTGSLGRMFGAWGATVVGVDFLTNVLRIAKHHSPLQDYICAAAEYLPIRNGCCDAVVLGDLLEHVLREQVVLNEGLRCLEKGGVLIITVPTPEWDKYQPQETEVHLRAYSRTELDQLLAENRHEVIELHHDHKYYARVWKLARRSKVYESCI